VKKDLLIILGILIIATMLRIIIPMGQTQLIGPDAYYEMRLSETYPNFPETDYYYNYPDGKETTSYPKVWAVLLAILKPIDKFLPAILGILCVIPGYIISRRIFNKDVAILAGLLIAVMPGQYLIHTQLGSVDHHALETFLMSIMMMFLILAVTSQKIKHIFLNLGLYYITLVVYLYSWSGGKLGIFLLGIILMALILIKIRNKYHKVTIFAVVFWVCISAVYITGFNYQTVLSMFIWDLNINIGEMMPLLFTRGMIDINTLWANFGLTFYISLIGLGMFIYKLKRTEYIILVYWFVVILAMTLAQRRYCYYLAPVLAIISGYVLYQGLFYFKKVMAGKRYTIVAILLVASLLSGLIITGVSSTKNSKILLSSDVKQGLEWLKQYSTPEYFTGQKAEYGAACWWDFGYYFVYETHIPVMVDPSIFSANTEQIPLLASEPEKARQKFIEKSIRYIFLDKNTVEHKLYAIEEYSGQKGQETFYYRAYYEDLAGFKEIYRNPEVRILEVIK